MSEKEQTAAAGQETAHITTKVEGAHAQPDDSAPVNVDDAAKQVIRSFSELPAAERVKLFDLLERAIHLDRDHLSVGRDPGSDHYKNLIL